MNLSVWLKGHSLEALLWFLKSKAFSQKAGRNLDKKLDEEVGDKKSGVLRRGSIMSMFGQFFLGFWHQNLVSLAVWHEQQAKDIRRNLTKRKKK